MRLPDAIERSIDREAAAMPGKALARAAESLTVRYRDRDRPERPARAEPAERSEGAARPVAAPTPARADTRTPAGALTDVERLAYAIVRAPATYAAVSAVLAELRERAPALRLATLLDLGAGPGAATWAALAQRGDLRQATLIERDRGFIELGRRILSGRDAGTDGDSAAAQAEASGTAPAIEWRAGDLRDASALPPHDLVIVSYALGELPEPAARRLIARAWEATRQVLIVIEPGTPHHFAGVLAARDYLIRDGACLVAPCPHASACPMAGADDWCHLAARVERTSLHRRLKSAALPYEDEKFSYVMAARTPIPPAATRIVRRPEIQKGFIALTLCTPEGLQREGVPRSRRDAFRRARKAAWGDAF